MNEIHEEAMRDTAAHISRVGVLLADCIGRLATRSAVHDQSKYSPEEWPAFREISHGLKALTYGSEEYKAQLRAYKPYIKHHQTTNSHHPEFHGGFVNRMTLLDLLEMLCDWKAAGERHADGSIAKSIEINALRFNLEPQLAAILEATAIELGWIDMTASQPSERDRRKHMRGERVPKRQDRFQG